MKSSHAAPTTKPSAKPCAAAARHAGYLKVPAPPTFQGHSLFEFLTGGAGAGEREVYSESLYAHDRLEFAPLYSLLIGNSHYIEAPNPELYNLTHDPAEHHNLAPTLPAMAQALKTHLLTLRSRWSPRRPVARTSVSPDVTADLHALHSLGYLVNDLGSSSLKGSGLDPKDGLLEYRQYLRGTHLLEAGDFQHAEMIFFAEGYYDLGLALENERHPKRAAQAFREALKYDSSLLAAQWALNSLQSAAKGNQPGAQRKTACPGGARGYKLVSGKALRFAIRVPHRS